MGSSRDIKVFLTAEHTCGYWPERRAQDLVLDPADETLSNMYERTLAMGFRRSGGHVYRPHCKHCRECIPVRVLAEQFQPSKSQRRILKRTEDLDFRISSVSSSPSHFDLYRRYLMSRHPDGPMADPEMDSYRSFLSCTWSPTRFLEVRHAHKLIAVAVTDVCTDALSAVYTFFDPDYRLRSLGTYCILKQIEWAASSGRPYVYLGFWIHEHPKMDYKRNFAPIQKLEGVRWISLE